MDKASSKIAPMSKTIEEILEPKPEARPRLYAYSLDDNAHAGLITVVQTPCKVNHGVAEHYMTRDPG